MEPTSFESLSIYNWRQFQKVELKLHRKLTVITGANGAGKTTLLNMFSEHFGWGRAFLATPIAKKDGTFGYVAGILARLSSLFTPKAESGTDIGEIFYGNSVRAQLFVPSEPGVEYGIDFRNRQTVQGINIPSHRTLSRFQQVANIPTTGIRPEQAYGHYFSEIINRYNGGHSQWSPLYRMKEALISMAMFGKGNEYAVGRPELLKAYLGFVEVLKKMLPDSLGFVGLSIRTPDVVVVTKSGEFLIDAASGGISAIIDLTWQIYLFSIDKSSFVVTIDEPENHLHPAMQRGLMRKLLSSFPNAQFIVATHSPFIVSSVRDSAVFVLAYERNDSGSLGQEIGIAPERSVVAIPLDVVNKAGTANEILREVLGLETTLPEWAEADLDKFVSELRVNGLTSESYKSVAEQLRERGLERLIPDVVEKALK